MNADHSLDLLLYGILLAGLNFAAHWVVPGFAGAVMKLLIAGGVSIIALAVLGLRGYRRRSWSIMSLIAVSVLLVIQTGRAWFAVKQDVDGSRPVAGVSFVLLFLAVLEVINIAKFESDMRD